MRKFSKITESKQFLGWSKERLTSEFKALNPIEFDIDVIYVSKALDGSSTWNLQVDKRTNGLTDIESAGATDDVFSPMFLILVSLGEIPKASDFHEIEGEQVDNWVYEGIKFDIVADEFQKLSTFLNRYKDDFYISIESGGHKWLENIADSRTGKVVTKNPNNFCTKSILSVVISLIMKDYFEYEQIL